MVTREAQERIWKSIDADDSLPKRIELKLRACPYGCTRSELRDMAGGSAKLTAALTTLSVFTDLICDGDDVYLSSERDAYLVGLVEKKKHEQDMEGRRKGPLISAYVGI